MPSSTGSSVSFRSGCQVSSKRYFGTKKILCQLVSVLKKVNKSQPFQVDFLREKCIEELNRRTQRQYGLGIERVMARELGLQKCLILTEKLFFFSDRRRPVPYLVVGRNP